MNPGRATAAAIVLATSLGLARAGDRPAAADTTPAAPRLPAERAPTVFAPVWDGLVGRWLGDDTAGNAQGNRPLAGATLFAWELDGRVLVRRGVVDYPPSNGHAGVHHEDLTTIYPAPDGLHAEAMYFDNDGHVIHYAATWASDGRSLVLLSFPEDGAPRYRLTWRFVGFDRLAADFDVAPPGSVDFAHYPGITLRRAGH